MNITDIRVSRMLLDTAHLVNGLGHLFFAPLKTADLWYERAKQRRRLAELDEHLLRDIGIDRSVALEEAYKPFWRG
jgi:uncharacterized protein YjiS (DUF1127 family)